MKFGLWTPALHLLNENKLPRWHKLIPSMQQHHKQHLLIWQGILWELTSWSGTLTKPWCARFWPATGGFHKWTSYYQDNNSIQHKAFSKSDTIIVCCQFRMSMLLCRTLQKPRLFLQEWPRLSCNSYCSMRSRVAWHILTMLERDIGQTRCSRHLENASICTSVSCYVPACHQQPKKRAREKLQLHDVLTQNEVDVPCHNFWSSWRIKIRNMQHRQPHRGRHIQFSSW